MAPKILLRNVRNVIRVRNVGMSGLMPRGRKYKFTFNCADYQTRPVIVQKLVIPELRVADSRESGSPQVLFEMLSFFRRHIEPFISHFFHFTTVATTAGPAWPAWKTPK